MHYSVPPNDTLPTIQRSSKLIQLVFPNSISTVDGFLTRVHCTYYITQYRVPCNRHKRGCSKRSNFFDFEKISFFLWEVVNPPSEVRMVYGTFALSPRLFVAVSYLTYLPKYFWGSSHTQFVQYDKKNLTCRRRYQRIIVRPQYGARVYAGWSTQALRVVRL